MMRTVNKDELAELVKAHINERGLSQAKFAKILGIGRGTVNNIVGGRSNPTMRIVRTILEEVGNAK